MFQVRLKKEAVKERNKYNLISSTNRKTFAKDRLYSFIKEERNTIDENKLLSRSKIG